MLNKLNRVNTHKEGFTIIEVLIVIAIGALIMVAVFLVVPQLQRSQRNARRQAEANRVLTATQQAAAAGGGLFTASTITPTTITNITGDVKNPSDNTNYSITVANATASPAVPGLGNIFVWLGGTCNAAGTNATTGGTIAVVMPLETATAPGVGAAANASVCVKL